MSDIPYVSATSLPLGWHGPTAGLLEKYQQSKRHGIAPSDAPHLSVAAQRFAAGANPATEEAIAALERFVSLEGEIVALGMAYPQLAAAAETGSLAVFAAMTDIGGLRLEDCRPGKVFVNPCIIPITSRGKKVDVEPCFSCLATSLVPEVERWNAVTLTSDNQPPIELEGAAAIVAQHEYDHIAGKLCVDVAFRAGRPVFYVPPELSKEFFEDFHGQNRRQDYPHKFCRKQWEATRHGDFTLERYL